MKILKEWSIDASWGKIALVSWGSESGAPTLLVHGREDSAATFEPLLRLLPATRHYVALDLPGHGRSDPLPHGVMLSRLHFIGAVQEVLRHLRWSNFAYVGHSMGCEPGLFFSVLYPRRVTRLVLLDPAPSLARLQVHDPVEYYASFHGQYYNNYHKFTEKKLYSKRRALESVMRARGFSAEQAELALARNLQPVGEDLFQLSWDRRLKYPAPTDYPTDCYYQIFKNSPPTLLISAKNSRGGYVKGNKATQKLISDLEKNVANFTVVNVEGGHDVHFTNPERFAKDVRDFLDKEFECKSKL